MVIAWMSSLFPMFNEGVEKIDLHFTYSPIELYEHIEPYSDEGRKAYAISHLTSDVLFPLIYAFLFGAAITYFYQRAFRQDSWLQRLILVPFVLLLVDILENIGLFILLQTYPVRMLWLARLTGWFTALKWTLSSFVILLLLFGLVIWIVRGSYKSSGTNNEDMLSAM
jgi:uncharacterized membrane protein YeiB